MDAASPDLLRELVRLSARVSAVIFIGVLAAGAAELVARPESSVSRAGAGWKLFGAVIVSHTIHFAFVIALAIETHGENMVDRGGWGLTIGVGVAFYIGTAGALVLRRVRPALRTVRNVAGDATVSILGGLAFLQPYLGRAGRSPGFAVLAVLLAAALVAFVAAVAVNISRRTQA